MRIFRSLSGACVREHIIAGTGFSGHANSTRGGVPVPAQDRSGPRVWRVPDYRFVRSRAGQIISSADRAAWLRARLWGVTATDARRLVTSTGRVSKQRRRLLLEKVSGDRKSTR